MGSENKALRVEIKDAEKGTVSAVFSTLNVKDHDGDVTVPEAFQDGAPVVISAYNHTSWSGALPVGKGVIRNVGGDQVTMEGQFFLNTQHGRDTFETVKALAEDGLGEWSYGFDVQEAEHGEFKGERVRYLKKLKVHEVSPVLQGAGIGTRTLSAKGRKTLNEEISFAAQVVAEVKESAGRVAALRAEHGEKLSKVNRDSVDALVKALEELKSLLTVDETETDAETIQRDELSREWLRAIEAAVTEEE